MNLGAGLDWLGNKVGQVLRSNISNEPEYSPGEQYIRDTARQSQIPPAPLPAGATLTDPGILHRAEMERQIAYPQGIVDATTGPLVQAAQQTPVGQVATAAIRAVAKPSDIPDVLREMYQADAPLAGRGAPKLRKNITGAEVLKAAEEGPGKFGGFAKYMERNPNAGEGLFDTSDPQPSLPGRPPVPRYDPSQGRGRGPSERAVDAFNNPKVIDGLKQYIQEGAQKLPADWYANSPLYKVYQKVWGKKKAEDKFFQQMGYQSATSSGSAVPDNIRTGSLYNYLHEQNLPFPQRVAPAPGEKPKLVVPKGYGHEMQNAHRD
ncbi:MAG TPA: hypothetical protein VNM37_01435, partial [Candidatus Dormibacteraeota bacterium]|nr:hypothetical protein [Candidatus Dormibacteraeota bacterium]